MGEPTRILGGADKDIGGADKDIGEKNKKGGMAGVVEEKIWK